MSRIERKRNANVKRISPSRGTTRTLGTQTDSRYLDFLAHLPVGVYRTTPEGRILEANPALADLLGYTQSELKRRNVEDLYAQKSQRCLFLEKFDRAEVTFSEFQLQRKDGRKIWGRDYCRPVKNKAGRVEFYDGVLLDITREKTATNRLAKAHARLRATTIERKQMIKRLESLTITDDLSGLYNRRGFYMFVQHHLILAARKKALSFLLYVDMDNLKRINDMFGHHVGDLAIVRLTEILKSTFRGSDIKARMGGDEFAVFPIDASPAGIDVVLARFKKNVAEANQAPDALIKLSISLGVAAFDPAHPVSIDELLVRADAMMYAEKKRKEGA